MKYCNLIPTLYLKQGMLYDTDGDLIISHLSPIEAAMNAENKGADELLIYEYSDSDEAHEQNIHKVREICDAVDIPVLLGGSIQRLEDVKKYLYAGAKMAVLDGADDSNVLLIKEAADRFGSEKIAVSICNREDTSDLRMYLDQCESFAKQGAGLCIFETSICDLSQNLLNRFTDMNMNLLLHASDYQFLNVNELTDYHGLYGFAGVEYCTVNDYMELKQEFQKLGIPVNVFESTMKFSDFKLGDNGLIPVVVQDYKTNEVLMLAYMNEEAFEKTLETGIMTYYSRSRQELWIKGLTSGHYQYVRSLSIDCDNDTLLAKVKQVGAACHTGNRSCFYTNLVKKEYDETNPMKVFEDVFAVIQDRKIHPKEGSYTNYLFDKGIDKILKKVGEEATEIVIAAKNPDKEEIKYEISDFLYHVMVLMAEKDVSWEEITRELARR